MIENVKEKEAEIKKIWLEKKETMTVSQLYRQFLGDYFDVANWSRTEKDWLFFLSWIRDWKRAIKKQEKEDKLEKDMEEMTDEGIEEVQKKNRKKMILILRDLIESYDTLEDSLKKALSIGEIRRMYKAIQSLEEKMKMTGIARGKLKLDAVRVLLPYKRMSPEELIALREKLNESFDRVLKLKRGEPVGRSAPDSG